MPQHRPRKRLGQHFLHDQEIIDRIIAIIAPARGQFLIEIGPGRGALTIPLLQHLGVLHVVELDRDLAAALEQRCRGFGTLHLYCQDVLKFNFRDFAAGQGTFRIAGNLPYNISTPLIFHLLAAADRITDMIFMLQEEVVDRLCADAGNKTYGRLSVMVQARCKVEKIFTAGAESFVPPPKVASALVKLVPRLQYGVMDQTVFATLVRQCFSQRRKTLRNALKGKINEQQMQNLGIDPGWRPELLTVEQFIQLANSVSLQE